MPPEQLGSQDAYVSMPSLFADRGSCELSAGLVSNFYPPDLYLLETVIISVSHAPGQKFYFYEFKQ
jgi:hypothetical protein